MVANAVVASGFWLDAYIVLLFDSHFSVVNFSKLKYILACQILHFSPQSVTQCAWQNDNNYVLEQFLNDCRK